jgi:N-acetylmuramoyl-L-alanine amidase
MGDTVIFVSAGHYPAAPGAKFERFIEHDEAVVWAQYIADILGGSGTLVPTGYLREKVAFINERTMNGDVAIEVHFNAATDSNGNNVGRGCESLYYPGSIDGEELANLCQGILAQYFEPDRGVKEGWYRMDPARGPDFFLAKTKCPAVIIEPEFVHRFAMIHAHREQVCTDLANALLIYEGEHGGVIG